MLLTHPVSRGISSIVISVVAAYWSVACADDVGGAAGGASGGAAGAGYFGSDCPGCECTQGGIGSGTAPPWETTLECFCCRFNCEPGSGSPDDEVIIEYANCNRRLVYQVFDNPTTSYYIDTETGELVGAAFEDDSGICSGNGQEISAGERPPRPDGPPPTGCAVSSCTSRGVPCPP